MASFRAVPRSSSSAPASSATASPTSWPTSADATSCSSTRAHSTPNINLPITVQLHLPRRPQQGDDGADRGKRPPVQRLGATCPRPVGGIEVARSETRMHELRRRMDSAKNWAIDDARLVTPAENGKRSWSRSSTSRSSVGSFYTPRGGRRRLAALRHAVPREGRGDGRPDRVRQHRGPWLWHQSTERIQSVKTTRQSRRGGVRPSSPAASGRRRSPR